MLAEPLRRGTSILRPCFCLFLRLKTCSVALRFRVEIGPGHHGHGGSDSAGAASEKDDGTLIRAHGDAEHQAKNRDGSVFHAEHHVTNGSVKRSANMADERLRNARLQDFTVYAHGTSFCSTVRIIPTLPPTAAPAH